jgi:hypothetical protein
MLSLITRATLLTQTTMVDGVFQHVVQATVRERTYEDLERLPTQWVDSRYPDWFQPDLLLLHQDRDYWVNVLPFEEDKNLDRYLVAPLQWAVIPIVTLTGDTYDTLLFGWNVDIMSYLEAGALHHPGTWWPWDWSGNYVLAWHTSYYSYRNGRYKTAMQFIALMQTWDPLWIFDKNSDGTRIKYRFLLSDSFETIPENVSILEQPQSWNYITLYWCYPFGTLDKRWVIQGELMQ